MTFENIDTPASIEELSGTADDADQNVETKDPVIDPAAVADVATAKEETKEEVQVDEPKPEREPVIPRARFDELNSKLHAEREETDRLRAELERINQVKAPAVETATVDIDALEQQHFDALMAGDKETAVSIRTKINAELYAQAEAASTEKITRQLSERESKTAFSGAVEKTLAAYPFLDSTSADSNPQAIADVVEWRDFYMAKGDNAATALQKAAAKIGPMYAASEEKTVVPPVVVEDKRKQAALARNTIDSAAQAPAPVAGIGNRAAPLAPKVETQEDLEKLSKAERDDLLLNS